MKYYLVAGERSGDLHGGNLIKALKIRDSVGEFRCFGGDYMAEAGAEVAIHYRDLALMGFLEILFNYRKIFHYLKLCREDILNYRPDVVILIDYSGFNLKIAKYCKEHDLKVYYYISPKIWAWKRKRAWTMKGLVDRMFVILPFEKDFYSRYGWEVDYVGNPVLDAVNEHAPNTNFRKDHNIPEGQSIIALLPGSRRQELKKIMPLMNEVISQFPDGFFVVAGVKSLPEKLYKTVVDKPNTRVIYGETYDLLNNSTAAIVTSGTATLETALWNVPQTVVYKTNPINYIVARLVVKVRYLSLVNLINGQEVIKELIQHQANSETVISELARLLKDEQYRKVILDNYRKMRNILGEYSAAENTAQLINKYLHQPVSVG